MSCEPITKRKFDALQAPTKPMEKLRVTQYQWFANEDGTLLGTVVFDPADQSWGSVILRAGLGECRVVQIAERLATQQDARLQLRVAMDGMDARSNAAPRSAAI
jgi:hypothetical protein